MSHKTKKKILVITGATATGKTAMSINLAKEFNGEIISADSRQIYKGLNIGTGKVTNKEMAGIPHYMLDIASPKRRISASDFQKMAAKKIENILQRGKLPIIVGGTGFYISALIDGTIFPDVPPNAKLRLKLGKKTAEQLMSQLKKIDSRRARKIDPKNKRRIIRALEIAMTVGSVPPIKCTKTGFDALWIGLNASPFLLRKKIKIRLIERIKMGMIAEAKKLHNAGLTYKRMTELGLEYKYLAMYLQKKISKTEMTKQLESAIWHYAKRQMTWFKKDQRIHWFDIESPTITANTKREVKKFLFEESN
ncbi:MAG: tRNA (adenosine(37)-N6)-dimethylallyltransferase MiaA [Candidatus Taylorbacteria bacterium RIFCSPLOWO2_01_FULL_43_44]|nr:MAG: tRNA (adenosine(37)-N6)-dimethylallyltransferase MiaA [Candidatus Taylorbacteria bacterium RIFCSPLOWO2_01_FULL_43_44]